MNAFDITLSAPAPYGLPRCSCCNAPVDGVVIFEVPGAKRIARMYEAQCHGAKATLVKIDGIERPEIVQDRHRGRMRRWDPFPVN